MIHCVLNSEKYCWFSRIDFIVSLRIVNASKSINRLEALPLLGGVEILKRIVVFKELQTVFYD